MHAVIEVAGANDITLIDLGNEPGTMVNGQRVNKCKIRPGDQIQIGSTMIHLEDAQLATGATPPPPATSSNRPAQMHTNTPTEAMQPQAVPGYPQSPATTLGMGTPSPAQVNPFA